MNLFAGAPLGADLWLIVKVMFLIGMSLYCVFAFVVTRQVGHMTKTLEVGFETPLRLLAVLHLIAAIVLLVFACVYL